LVGGRWGTRYAGGAPRQEEPLALGSRKRRDDG